MSDAKQSSIKVGTSPESFVSQCCVKYLCFIANGSSRSPSSSNGVFYVFMWKYFGVLISSDHKGDQNKMQTSFDCN